MDWLREHAKVTAVAVLVAAVALYFIIAGEAGDEARINARLDEVAELVSFDAPEPQLTQLGNARRLSELFVPRPYIVAWRGRGAVTDKDAIAGLFMTMRRMASSAQVEFGNRQITLDEDGHDADVTLTVSARIDFSGDVERDRGRYRMQFEKQDGEWKIVTVEPLD